MITRGDSFERDFPFGKGLEEEDARQVLSVATNAADDGEIFFERRRSEMLGFEDGRLKTASFDTNQGFGLRAVQGEVTGYAHSNELSISALERCADAASVILKGRRDGVWAAKPGSTKHELYGRLDPIEDLNFENKTAFLAQIDDYLRAADPAVIQVSASLASSLQQVAILRHDSPLLSDFRPLCRLSISVILDVAGRRESGSVGWGGRGSLEALMEPAMWKAKADEALRIARVNLDAQPAPAGVMDVVLGPGWPGILLHEAIGHGLEGDFNRKGSSAFAKLMGHEIAAPEVTVVDDGTLSERRGSLNFDDEGTPTQKTTLIENGVLTGYMQDRQNARLMGVAPTGNGRRESYAHVPMPRMTNTYMLNGNTAPQDLVADLKDGIYAVGFGGGQVDITNGKFVFSCTEAYHVKDGKIGAPLKGATLIGDGATALRHIKAVGNDLALDPGIGTCGKAGQWVPVGVGQPSLYISGLTIGGAA